MEDKELFENFKIKFKELQELGKEMRLRNLYGGVLFKEKKAKLDYYLPLHVFAYKIIDFSIEKRIKL